jgi:asparagine synthase (glutamine-hydrolysing)
MLSGGIDSASIAGAARVILKQLPNKHLNTFSVVSDKAAACSETKNIQSIIEGYDDHAHLIAAPSLKGVITVDDLKEAAWKNAQPVANSVLLPAMVYLAASRSDHRVVLDGVDGDLTTSTHVRYTSSLLRSHAWRKAWAECREASVNNTYLRHEAPLTILSKSAWQAFAPSSFKRLRRRISSVVRGRPALSLINPDFANDIRLAEKLRAWQAGNQSSRPLSEQERHIRVLLPVNIPRAMEGFDRIASRYGIEARHPWSDKSLIEFYVRLPLHYKVRKGWTKYLVRQAAAPWLHRDVRWHTGKHHLGSALVDLLLNQSYEEMINALGATRGASEAIGKYLDTKALSALLTGYSADRSNLGPLYDAMTLAHWLGRLKAT